MGNFATVPPMFFWTSAVLLIWVAAGPTLGSTSMETDLGDMEENVRVANYFHDVDGDLTKVTWAHAVNSEYLLKQALNSDVMMLEADILMGTDTSSSHPSEIIPIMAHPPATTSDLSFEDFLKKVLKSIKGRNKKGIKLDFKDIAAVAPVLRMIEKNRKRKSLDFPIWINADIWKGPYESKKAPLDPTAFLSAVMDSKAVHFTPTLSLGWTTRYGNETGDTGGGHITTGEYTAEHVDEALRSLSSAGIDASSREVTFPVRAGLAAHPGSHGTLLNLVEKAGTRATLTIWSKEGDSVDIESLEHLIETVGRTRVYLDLPFPLSKYPQEQFSFTTPPSTTTTVISKDSEVDSDSDKSSSSTEKPPKSKKKDKKIPDIVLPTANINTSGIDHANGGKIVVDAHDKPIDVHVNAGTSLGSMVFTSMITFILAII